MNYFTCSGMTIMKIFLSLSESMGLMNVQPVPISTIVMNKTEPFSLWWKKYKFLNNLCTKKNDFVNNFIKKKKKNYWFKIWKYSILFLYLQMRNVIQNRPSLNVFTAYFDKMIVNGVEHERQRFKEHQ